VTRGGRESLYPEYVKTIEQLMRNTPAAPAATSSQR
jgi:hypothetical protein